MKKKILIGTLVVIVCGAVVWRSGYWPAWNGSVEGTGDQTIAAAFQNHASNIQVEGEGTVVRILEDDLQKPRHQRFILRLASGQTLLVTHNIDLAPRIDGLAEGDQVQFNGEYEWNEKGGVIHWTHHDPGGQHPPGWLKRGGRTYQ